MEKFSKLNFELLEFLYLYAPKNASMIDWHQIQTLRAETGPDGFDEIVTLFLQEMREAVHNLQTRPDSSRLEADLHGIKGSSATLGFAELSDLCGQGEKAAKTGWGDTVDLDAIHRCYVQSITLFMTKKDQRLAG